MNIYLTGIMGCGKTTLGKLLAEKCQRSFLDLDAYIVQREGRSIQEIFDSAGEEGFRECETAALAAVKGNCIVATGGGAPLREENARIMRENGAVCFIFRPVADILADIDADARPLIRDDPQRLYAIYEARKAIYLERADVAFDNYGPAEEAVERLYMALRAKKLL